MVVGFLRSGSGSQAQLGRCGDRAVGGWTEEQPVTLPAPERPGGVPATAGATDVLAALADLPGVAEAGAAARTAVDRLLGHRILRRRSAEVTVESALRGARASAALEAGLEPALEAALEAALDGAPVPRDRLDAVADGALRLYAELGTMRSSFELAPRQALARMHVLAARGLAPDEQLGRPRLTAAVDDPLGLGPAPGPAEVSARLDALVTALTRRTAASALVVAAIVHGELLVLRPFAVANGLVARAAARLVLVTRGLDPKSVSSPEVGHRELGAQYADAARRYAGGGSEGVAVWLVHCADAVALGAREGLAVCTAIERGP